jgi:hypothetical protein
MNYQEHYDRLISRARNRKLDCYSESHHIIPRCMNGTDDKDNLVRLTAREHFIAHLLLVKIYPKSYGLVKAIKMMCTCGTNQVRSMNRMYGWLKEKYSKVKSIEQLGENNSQYGTMYIHNKILQQNKKIKKEELAEYIQSGWAAGVLKIKCERCMKEVSKITFDRHKTICNEKESYDEKKQKTLEQREEIKKAKEDKRDKLRLIFEDYKTHGYKYVVEKYDYKKTEGALYSMLKILFGDFRKIQNRIQKEYTCKHCGIIFSKLSSVHKENEFSFCSQYCASKYGFKKK